LLTVFGFGLRASFDDVLYLFHRPGLLGRSLLAMFVIMPIVAVALLRLFDAPRNVEIVLVALAISPIPPLLPKKLPKLARKLAMGLDCSSSFPCYRSPWYLSRPIC
jgi:BASS family bile acid:Na+ symporter